MEDILEKMSKSKTKIKLNEYSEKVLSLTITNGWEFIWQELTLGAFAQGLTTLPMLCVYSPELEREVLDLLEEKYLKGYCNPDSREYSNDR